MEQHMNQSLLMEYELTFYLDDTTTSIFEWALFTAVCQVIDVFGIVTNIINIIFTKSIAVIYLVFGMPHFAFTRVSGCITAFITLERCLSIVMPLKVI
ncbi:unnamed protein product, partial [Candidula unifasciata]